MQKLKKDDRVIVIAGKDKGKTGAVTRIMDGRRLYVSGVNMIKRHTKGNPQMNQPGGIIEKEAPIDLSNIALYNPNRKRGDRFGIKKLEDGKKVRFFRSDNEVIDLG